MNADPKSAKAIFLEAVEHHAPAEWPAFLDRACGDQLDLRVCVEALLAAHREIGTVEQSGPAEGTAPSAAKQPTREVSGIRIGAYKLIEQIGEGGMGTVWMAQQTEPIKRLVAIKLIKEGMDSKQVITRFEAERQALALMDHPNIARVLDGDTTDTGRPYFVMDLVKGIPITTYCDDNRLTPRQRLELFVPVCQAVQHAHQKGIIHRDLKPSNVLIALYDGKPVPKVIDFGVAKAYGQPLTEQTLVTGFGSIVGTLEYMSPEQAELNQLNVDTRSDIYSLGVLLYELLTGTTPLQRMRIQQTAFTDVLRMIRDEEPPWPSKRLSTTAELASIAASRGAEPKKLHGMLRGELDCIVMKCLEKERNRRYESASALAADVQRHLADEPVEACPPSTVYRFCKFARRNTVAFVATAAIAVSLLAGTAVATWQAGAARQAATDAQEQRRLAQENLRIARAAVDRMYTRLAKDLANIPHMERVRRELLEDALVFYQGFLNQESQDPQIRYETALAYIRVGKIQFMLGRLDHVEVPVTAAIALLEDLSAEYPLDSEYRIDLADSYYERSRLYGDAHLRQPNKSLEYALQALEIKRKLVADFPKRLDLRTSLAWNLNHIALCYSTGVRDYAQSERYFAETLATWEQMQSEFGEDPDILFGVSHTHHWLGSLHLQLNRLQEAEAEIRQALSQRERLLQSRAHDLTLRSVMAHNKEYLASILLRTGRTEEAETLLREAIDFQNEMLDSYPDTYEAWRRLNILYGWLADCLWWTGRTDEAERTIQQRKTILRKMAEDFSGGAIVTSNLALSDYQLGLVFHATGRRQEAADLFRSAIGTLNELTAQDPHAEYAYLLGWMLATCPAVQLRDPERSLKLAQHALQREPEVWRHWMLLGIAQYRVGAFSEAINALEKSRSFGNGGDGRHLYFLAMAHWQLGNRDEARQWFDNAVAWTEKHALHDKQLRQFRIEAEEVLGITETESQSDGSGTARRRRNTSPKR